MRLEKPSPSVSRHAFLHNTGLDMPRLTYAGYNCGSKNVFMLGFIPAKSDTVVVLLCRYVILEREGSRLCAPPMLMYLGNLVPL